MEIEFDDQISLLADKIDAMIPVEWEKLYYLGEVGQNKSSWSSVFYFVDAVTLDTVRFSDIPTVYQVSEQIYKGLLREVNMTLIQLYDAFIAAGQPRWNQAKLYIESSGKFSIDFSYEDADRQDWGPAKTEAVWAYETFGKMPAEGSFAKGLLDEYLHAK